MHKKSILTVLVFCSLFPISACKTTDLNPTLESEMASDKDSTPLITSIYTNSEVYDNLSDYDKKIVTGKRKSLEYSLKSGDKKSVVSDLIEMSKLYDDFAVLLPKPDQESKAKKLSSFARRSAKLVESGEKPF